MHRALVGIVDDLRRHPSHVGETAPEQAAVDRSRLAHDRIHIGRGSSVGLITINGNRAGGHSAQAAPTREH